VITFIDLPYVLLLQCKDISKLLEKQMYFSKNISKIYQKAIFFNQVLYLNHKI